jgi:predicted acyl esterase
VLSAGPASLGLKLSVTAPETGVWAVVSDVSPDGTAHPVATGRLSTDYPGVNRKRSVTAGGEIVQPYGRYDLREPAPLGFERFYRVELWPIGNRFRAGHRIRLEIVGASAASLPSAPGLNTVTAGGPGGSRFLFPVLPGSDLKRALGGKR